MLSVSRQVLGAMEDYYRPQFLDDMVEILVEDYPHFLPRFPPVVRRVIVANMLARAARWGMDRQNGFSAWCGLMIDVAGNFDDQPDIAAMLQRMGPGINQSIFDLPDLLPDPVWRQAADQGSVLPMVVSAQDMATPDPRRRSVPAVQLVLGDRPEARQPGQAVQAADPQVNSLRLGGLADAWLVVAACRSFYGPQFDRMPWMRQLADVRLPPRGLLEAMRLRIAIDLGRWT